MADLRPFFLGLLMYFCFYDCWTMAEKWDDGWAFKFLASTGGELPKLKDYFLL